MDKKAVLVTGATGFIGSHVARELADSGKYRVVAVVRQTDHYKNTDQLSADGVLLVKGIFYDEKVLEPLFREYRIEYVIHLAALRGAGKQGSYDEVNVKGTERLLEASLRNNVRKFIFCSSVGVFGTIPCEVPASAGTRLNGDTVYHNSKILAEAEVRKYMEKGLDAFIVRPSITYGKGDDGFPATLIKLVRKRYLFLPKYPGRIHLLDVKSLAELFCNLLVREVPTVRIMAMADESPIRLWDLANLISRFYFGKDYPSVCRISPHLFTAMEAIFDLIGSEKWTTRIQLISKDWYYDVSPIRSISGMQSAKTEQNFLRYLKDAAV
jgi:nucleoside-diphosphate-sugar epimerase